MKLYRIKCKHFVHAWVIAVSDSCLVGCMGRRAGILDRAYQPLRSIEGLDYVYAADVSPDEGEVLLVTNAGTRNSALRKYKAAKEMRTSSSAVIALATWSGVKLYRLIEN